MADLERALRDVSFFSPLRPDELRRAAARFRPVRCLPGEPLTLGDTPCFALVVSGQVRVALAALPGQPRGEALLGPGDGLGDVALAAGQLQPATLSADKAAELALLDQAGLAQLLAEFPIIAVPLVQVVADELRFKDGLIRELGEVEALGLSGGALEGALSLRRRALRRHGARILRRAASAIYREVIVARGREPAFWMLLGFSAALLSARIMVSGILRFHLEHALFATTKLPGAAHPMHFHHFNYGLILVAVAGLGAFSPRARQLTRLLPALFGFGAGLVLDEWALIWNLDPNYYQRLSYAAAALVFTALAQLVLFRRFWSTLAARALRRWAL